MQGSAGENRQQEIADISRNLKNLARALNEDKIKGALSKLINCRILTECQIKVQMYDKRTKLKLLPTVTILPRTYKRQIG